MLTKHTDLYRFADVSYLTEDSLYNSIVAVFQNPERFIHDKPVKGSGQRFRPDVYDTVTKRIWEFDGAAHFTNPQVITRDAVKTEALLSGRHVTDELRIPYFVQPTDTTIGALLDLNHDAFFKPEFPHGFIGKKCVTPAFFCAMGIERFKGVMAYLMLHRARGGSPYSAATEILQSMWLRVKCYGERPEEVYFDPSWYNPYTFPHDTQTQVLCKLTQETASALAFKTYKSMPNM